MKRKLLTINHAVLFLCTAMYFGTGWSLVLFSFPVASELTVDTYYMQFVPQVTAATTFFTYMTMLMFVVGGVMVWSEWKTRYRWVPIVVLLGVIAATGLTMWKILPLNDLMAAGITDPDQLTDILDRWMGLNRIRVSLWTVQWLAMMTYFGAEAYRAGEAG